MSGYGRQRGRSGPGRSGGRFGSKNVGPRTVWKPKVVKSDESPVTGESVVKDVSAEVKDLDQILKSLDDDDDGNNKKVKQYGDEPQNDDDDDDDEKSDESPIAGESVVEDVAAEVTDYNEILKSLDDDDNNKKVQHVGDESRNDDVGNSSKVNHPVFDICPKTSSGIKLKPPLHVMNKEIRNQNKQAMQGPNITILEPGMVLLKGYISAADQISIVKTCRDLGIGNGGFYQPGYGDGKKLHLHMMCLGKSWDPGHMYTELRPFDKAKPPGIPEKFHDMVVKAIHDSNEFIRGKTGGSDEGKGVPSMSPDICIVNFYTKSGRLGLHQDKDESDASLRKGLPVVSFSIGDSADFLYGETRNVDEAKDVILESGDVLIFGGKSRLIYHGVTSILPDSAPTWLKDATDMRPGRLNLTFRMY